MGKTVRHTLPNAFLTLENGYTEQMPEFAERVSPIFARLTILDAYVDPVSNQTLYNRSCIEDRSVRANPDDKGLYSISLQTAFHFYETQECRDVTTYTKNLGRAQPYDDAIAIMENCISVWRQEGFTDNVIAAIESPSP